MPRFFKVPEARAAEPGIFIGGGWLPFKDGIAEVPDGVDYSWALPGFVEVTGPQVPGAAAPEVLPAPEQTPAKASKASS